MKIKVMRNSETLGKEAAAYCAQILNNCIHNKGKARLVMSTGASQFDLLKALVKENVDWSKVEMFHLDEYIDLPVTHPASFRKYLKERFTSLVNLKAAHFVNGEGDIQANIKELSEEIRKETIDLGLIGIGENAHIAFNDPPADFDTHEPYIVVNLDNECKQQQAREGWFPSVDDVPKQAISMSVYQIMQCNTIVSFVPYKVKANAVKFMLESELTNRVPATMLKNHSDITLYLDEESASTVDKEILKKYLL
jgi:glucosamine-6-phosphate deaminase